MIEPLHFLRPDWFYAFIPLGVLLYLIRHRQSSCSNWQRVCDPQLMPHILSRVTIATRRLPLFLAFIAAALTIVSLAGPVWKQLPTPVFTDNSALVIALDLSQSMNSNDAPPSRIARAKLKTQDLLGARKTGQTALIVYAAKAYTVTPLTEDTNTILNLLPTLETDLMPFQGSAADTALKLAANFFEQSNVKHGDVLLITDDASRADIQAATQLLAQGHRVSVLAVGTTEGAPIPIKNGFLTDEDGTIIIPALERDALRQLTLAGGGRYVELQNDDTDTAELTSFYAAKMTGADVDLTDLSADTWREEGPWLLLLVIPVVALWSRRGWLACLAICCLPLPEPVHAFDIQSLWWSKDQKAQRQFNQGNHSQAAGLFQIPDWKAAAFYNTGNYPQAIKILETLDTSDAYYNKGNALARLNRFPEAIKAYDEAIRRNENHNDARHNRLLVQQALVEQEDTPNLKPGDAEENPQDEQGMPPPDGKPQDSSSTPQEGDDQSSSSQQAQRNPDNDADENAQPSDQENTDPQSANDDDAQQNSEPEDSEQISEDESPDEQMTDSGDADTDTSQENDKPPQPENSDTVERNEQELVTEQWLNRIPDDPGGLLRRKFLHQYSNQAAPPQSSKTW